MIKIGINGVTKSGEKYISSKELKLSIGEIVSARVEKGGMGEGKIKIKGYEIDAKGAKEFKNGEVLSLVIKGMENGKLLVEDMKSENKSNELKTERGVIERAKLKEVIIKEIVEQKGNFSTEKLDKIVANFQKIESEIKKNLEKQVREEFKIEKNEKEFITDKNTERVENREKNKIKEFIDNNEKIIKNLLEDKNSKERIEQSDINRYNEKSITDIENKTDIILDKKEIISEKPEQNNKFIGKEQKSENIIEKKNENRETFLTEEKKEESVIKKNLKEEKEYQKVNSEKNGGDKINGEKSMEISRFYINSKIEKIKQSEILKSDVIKKEIADKYQLSDELNLNEYENVKKPEKEIAEFIIDKKSENFKNEIIKTLVKLENAETGLNPEIFKKVFEFYDKAGLDLIKDEKNSKSGIKNYIKDLAEGKEIKSESTTIVNVLNKMENKNIIEFMLNLNFLKNPAEIKIKSDESGDKFEKKSNISYITINLEPEKIGKMAVSIVLAEKSKASLSFYVSNENIKEHIKSDEEELKSRFSAKGISVENINIKDLKEEEEENKGINCKI